MLSSHNVYWLLDFLVLIFPLILSFTHPFRFVQEWKHFLLPNIITAILFLIWDALFTAKRIWWFNSHYISGLYILNLPIEEILFFFCIPYACTFSYYVLNNYLSGNASLKISNIFILILLICLPVSLFLFPHRLYTFVTFSLLLITLLILVWKKEWHFLNRFLQSYLFIIPFFFLSNGTLTGGLFLQNPVVFYNEQHIIGIRVLNIPVEDFFYGMLLLLWNIRGYEAIKTWHSK